MKTLKFLLIFCALLSSLPAQAELRLNITRGVSEKIPVAVTDFYGTNLAEQQKGQEIARVVEANLARSGLFERVDQNSFIQDPETLLVQPRFDDWRAVNAQALVSGKLVTQADGRLRVEFRLWDVLATRQMLGLAYVTTFENWRRIAHIISDSIYERLTGEKGYFDTRVVYVSETGAPDQRIKRLAIMDQDGENHRFLTDGSYLVLTPRFSPVSADIVYMAYIRDTPRVYLYNIDTGHQEVLGSFSGMTFAPRFSSDGKKVVMSLSSEGASNIYVMDIKTHEQYQLTNNFSINTAPSFSPDGKNIVFESDRGGSQQLYVMKADGSDVRRITFGNGRYANPVWSPRGDLIAFTKMYKGQFYIGVIQKNGSRERLITKAHHVEGPTWSPNGRVLMYFKEIPTGPDRKGRQSRLYTIDITGFNEQLVQTPLYGSDPAWSPLIP